MAIIAVSYYRNKIALEKSGLDEIRRKCWERKKNYRENYNLKHSSLTKWL